MTTTEAPMTSRLIGFPNPVNEKAARTVAGTVLLIAIVTLVLSLTAGHGWLWIAAPVAAGFLARVLTGPKLSPIGQFATRVVAPHLGEPKMVAGPPKRFAQAVGLVVTGGATAFVATGHPLGAQILFGLMIVAAGLESIFAYCLGCKVFGILMRFGWIPEETCEACNNVQRHLDDLAARTTEAAV
jgi:hypothetical protein